MYIFIYLRHCNILLIMMMTVRVALLQVSVTKDKNQNLSNARDQVKRAAENGSQFIVLPEMFQTPYSNDSFPVYAEYIDDSIVHTDTAVSIDADRSPSVYALQQMAKENNIWLVGGSISERDSEGRIYNTSVVFDPHGRCVAKHRKVHLFDIDVPGKQTFKESDTLTAGNEITVFDSPYGKVGLGICYDLRFPLLFQAMRQAGCSIFVLPGCFNLTTGSLHWEALLRARAIDYQCYMMAVSQARDENFSYKAWGHSTVVNPWGEVLATTEHHPDIVYADLELMKVDEARKFIPTSQQQRTDLYKCTSILDNSKNS
jgi:omega-amidase